MRVTRNESYVPNFNNKTVNIIEPKTRALTRAFNNRVNIRKIEQISIFYKKEEQCKDY